MEFENRVLVGTIPKNRTKSITVRVGEFEGTVYIYSQVIETGDEYSSKMPWMTVRPSVAEKYIDLLKRGVTAARELQEKTGPSQEPENRQNRSRRGDDLNRMLALKGVENDS